MVKTSRLCLGIVLLIVIGCQDLLADRARDGDIIFQTSRSNQSLAIQLATRSKYSHMGVIFIRDGKQYVCEANKTVRYTPLKEWIAHGEGGHFVIKRLRDAERILTPEALAKLRNAAEQFLGKPYDLTFEWSDTRIYCSELVWKTYDRGLGIKIGRLQRLKDFDLSDPAVKTKMRERFGEAVPMEETVISPGEMFSSEALILVIER